MAKTFVLKSLQRLFPVACVVVELYERANFEARVFADGLGFVASRDNASVVVAEYNDRASFERRVKDSLTRNKEIVAVAKAKHIQTEN